MHAGGNADRNEHSLVTPTTREFGTDPFAPSGPYTHSEMPSNKSFRTKVVLAKAAKQNRCVSPRLRSTRSPLFADSSVLYSPIPQWFRLKSDSKIQYNGT